MPGKKVDIILKRSTKIPKTSIKFSLPLKVVHNDQTIQQKVHEKPRLSLALHETISSSTIKPARCTYSHPSKLLVEVVSRLDRMVGIAIAVEFSGAVTGAKGKMHVC